MSAQRQALRNAIDASQRDGPVFAPLALDALTARIAEAAGFIAGYVSGGALGYSHAVSEALLTVTELADTTRHVTARSGLSIIVDAGVGFGDAVHVARAVADLEATGAAAIEIEDQVAPKRASHHRGIEHLVSLDEMIGKIRHAVTARTDPDFLIIARTGAVANESFESAIERCQAFADAGADLAMLMPKDPSQWLAAAKQIPIPLAAITSLDLHSKSEWQDLGWSLIIDPFTAQVLSVQVVETAYRRFMTDGATGTDRSEIMATYRELSARAGLDEYYAIEDDTTLKED
jgi:2-methylisocitrate lyase-like PEP mutase family enzyme